MNKRRQLIWIGYLIYFLSLILFTLGDPKSSSVGSFAVAIIGLCFIMYALIPKVRFLPQKRTSKRDE